MRTRRPQNLAEGHMRTARTPTVWVRHAKWAKTVQQTF